jgi:hypothetical protein
MSRSTPRTSCRCSHRNDIDVETETAPETEAKIAVTVTVTADADADAATETDRTRPLRALVGRVDDLLAARVPELRFRVQVARPADRDLERVRGPPYGDPGGAPLRRVDQQARIVGADRPRPDEDRVDGRPYLVDAVEVGRGGEQQALGAGVVEVAVEGDGGGQQDVGVRHRTRSLSTRAGLVQV